MKKFLAQFTIYQWIIIILTVVVNVFIIVNSCLDGNHSSQSSGLITRPLIAIINGIKADTINESNIDTFTGIIRKLIGHFGLFLVSGLLTTLSIKFIYLDKYHKYWLFIIFTSISGIFLASLTEIIQLTVPGRSGEIKDVFIDLGGYVIGLLIIALITYFQNKNNVKIENQE